MALIVEDGTGKSDANSLVTLAEFKAYHDLRANVYDTYDDEVIEAALIRFCQYLNGLNWIGVKAVKTQSLCFPRRAFADYYSRYYYVDDLGPAGGIIVGGYEVPVDEVPQPVKDAQCEGAFVELGSPNTFLGAQAVGVKSETIDVLSFEYDLGAGGGTTQYPVVDMLISAYLQVGIVGHLVRS